MRNLHGKGNQRRLGPAGRRWLTVAGDAALAAVILAVTAYLTAVLPRDGVSILDGAMLSACGLAAAAAVADVLVRVVDAVRARRDADDSTWLEPWQ